MGYVLSKEGKGGFNVFVPKEGQKVHEPFVQNWGYQVNKLKKIEINNHLQRFIEKNLTGDASEVADLPVEALPKNNRFGIEPLGKNLSEMPAWVSFLNANSADQIKIQRNCNRPEAKKYSIMAIQKNSNEVRYVEYTNESGKKHVHFGIMTLENEVITKMRDVSFFLSRHGVDNVIDRRAGEGFSATYTYSKDKPINIVVENNLNWTEELNLPDHSINQIVQSSKV